MSKRINITVSDSVYEKLNTMSVDYGMPVSSLGSISIMEYLEKRQLNSDKIDKKITELEEVLHLYNELNIKTKNKFDWRVQGLQTQLEILEELRDNSSSEWMLANKEDSANI